MIKRASSAERGYGERWRKYRLGFLRKHSLCVDCAKQGKTTMATVVDHVTPHKGDQALFWDKANHQPLCKTCHDSHKRRLELSGRVVGCDSDGRPLDPNHAWHQQGAPRPG